jgi:hypothetical protein
VTDATTYATGEQAAAAVVMVRPAAFTRNDVTRPSNRFQSADADLDPDRVARAALREFDELVRALEAHGITVHVFAGRTTVQLPDEIFPNNWLSTHADGTIVLYPLMAWNRRGERRTDILDALQQRGDGYRIERIVDLTCLEERDQFLEGTGSLVLDRVNHIGFACQSPRTHIQGLREFGRRLGYGIVAFEAFDHGGHAIYHTNVMMSVGERFAVVCLDAVRKVEDRYRIVSRLERSGREVIELRLSQLPSFAGNLIELHGTKGSVIALSAQAAAALDATQLEALQRHGTVLTADVGTIERYGGGSVRCMLAEVFLPRKARA